MELIQTQIIASAQSSFVFTNIPQTFDDLLVKFSLRAATGTGHYLDVELDLNGESSRTWRGLYAITPTPDSNSGNFNIAAAMNGNTTNINTFSNGEIYLPNYRSTSVKSISSDYVAENNSTTQFNVSIGANVITNGAAVSQITLRDGFGTANFATNSSVSLYGITRGSFGGVIVS